MKLILSLSSFMLIIGLSSPVYAGNKEAGRALVEKNNLRVIKFNSNQM